MEVNAELINGIKFGIEHIALEDREEDDPEWVVILDILIFRIALIKYS